MTSPPPPDGRPPIWLFAAGMLILVALLVLAVACSVPDAQPAHAGHLVPVPPAVGPTIAPPRPAAVTVPRIGAHSTLIETGILPDGTAEVPPVETPEQASWLRESPVPGEVGPAILYGHVDGGGKAGVFHDLDQLKPGDEVLVDRHGAPQVRFEVYQVQSFPKAAFPTDLAYGDTQGAELRAITCGGTFDRATGHYRDNVIVSARLAS